jgi:sugar (pentulose or hexulose) kinase
VKRGGTALIVGFNSSNNNNGNVIKATLISVMFNLVLGTKQVEEANEKDDDDDYDGEEEEEEAEETTKKEIVLTGGLTKTPQTGQILADIFDRPVRLLEAADEGGAWGAALLAKYYHDCSSSSATSASSSSSSSSSSSPDPNDWLSFLKTIKAKEEQVFFPHPERVQIYHEMLTKYKKLLKLQPQLDEVMNGPP